MGKYYNLGKEVLYADDEHTLTIHIADAMDPEAAHSLATAMNQRSENFIKNALRTCSPNFYGDKVSKYRFVTLINEAIRVINELDKVKKSLFYGKLNGLEPVNGAADTSDLPLRFGDTEPEIAIDFIHGILGKVTEAGELLEAMREAINVGKPLDLVNINEEIGDGFWYDAILLNRTDTTFEEVQATIIRKLKARFPDKFSDTNANERDLAKERAILEGPQQLDYAGEKLPVGAPRDPIGDYPLDPEAD